MAHNVQLSHSERTVCYRDLETKRILGFGPEGFPPAAPAGVKYTATVCYSAKAIERFAEEYRSQSLRDREETSLRRLEAERPIRQAIKSALAERNNHLDPKNRDYNNAMLRVMDHFYDTAVEARQKVEVCIAAEKYEASKTSGDITLENSKIQLGAS